MTAQYDKRSGHGPAVHDDQAAPHEEMAEPAAHEYDPVRTQITHSVAIRVDSEFSTHRTFAILPQTSMRILPLDPTRYKATIWCPVAGYFVVLCDSLEQAQSSTNFATVTNTAPSQPQGCLIGTSYKVEEYDGEPLWAVNCDPSATAYLSVLIERAK